MIPRIAHQTAPTKELSWEEARLARRIRRMLPDWEYRLWDDADNKRLMAEHFPDMSARYERVPFGVAKADIARYAYLAVHGGFYFDTDYKLLKPIDQAILDQACVIPLEDVRPHDGPLLVEHKVLGNAVMGSSRGHPFWRDLIAFILEEKRADQITDRRQIIAATGPAVVTEFYMANRARYGDIVLPNKNAFQPDISMFAMRSSADQDTYGIHLHWGSWRGRDPMVALRIMLRRKLNALAG